MNHCLVTLLLLLPTGLTWAQVSAPTTYFYNITGHIGQLSTPAKVYLMHGDQVLQSITLQQGRFELKGITPFPHSATLVLEREGRLQHGWGYKVINGKSRGMKLESPDRLSVFLEPSRVVLTSVDSLRTARVMAGELTKEYHRLEALTKPVLAKEKVGSSRTEFEDVYRELAQVILAFAKVHPASWVSLEALGWARSVAGMPQYAQVAPIYTALTPSQRASAAGQEYGALLAGIRVVAIGSPAPAFTQQTPSGRAVSLVDYQGKYVLIEFWASWCGPCRAQTPDMLKVYKAFKGRKFDILGVSLDKKETRHKWIQAIAADHTPWIQVSDLQGFESKVAQQYGVRDIPQNFLLDPNGKIIASNLRGSELLTTLAKLIH